MNMKWPIVVASLVVVAGILSAAYMALVGGAATSRLTPAAPDPALLESEADDPSPEDREGRNAATAAGESVLRKVEQMALDQAAPVFDEDIQGARFMDITADNLAEILQAIKVVNGDLVSEEQLRSLRSVLEENIWAFKTGSSEMILADRLRAPYKVIPAMAEADRKYLREYYGVPAEDIPEDERELLLAILMHQNEGQSGGPGFRDIYTRISPEASEMTFQQASSLPAPLGRSFIDRAKSGQLRLSGIRGPNPHVEYVNSPESVLKDHKSITFVDVRLATEDPEAGRFSRIKRLYWSPSDNTWLAWDVVSLSKKSSTRLEFF